ncbi:Flowering time control protein fca [Thalictrum thalictroides]|uniref:Flowering time control protein fca n=1 Tax=Thalictrum thalictroides TaxID=46969 RepID=A0A7J6US39_THATH|nr:Flowering time control protein fca [Thalictrum thalictroides]
MPYRQFTNNTNSNNNRYNNNRNPNPSEATHNQQWNQCNGTSQDHSFDGFRDKDHVDAHSMPLSGLKRPFPISDRADHTDNGGLIKLFIANVPRRAIEDDIRPLFEEHGNVVEIFLIRDRTSGQRRGCCFVKYSTLEDAERAIKALHSQYTFPGEYDPIQVRYADGEWQRLRSLQNERKLYVAELNKQATKNEITEIFSTYGRVEDVCILRDEMKQSLGCGFVEFVQRDMALAAINALNGTYVMTGCGQPLIVRFAKPRKPKAGDSRNDAAFRGSRVYTSQGIRPESNGGNPNCVAHTQPNGWKKTSPQSSGPSSQAHDFASHSVAKNGAAAVSMATNSKHLLIKVPSGGELLPLEKPLHPSLQLVPSLKLHTQGTPYTSQMQTSLPPMQQLDQLQVPTSVGPFSQALSSEHFNGNRGHSTQFHSQQSTFTTTAQQISLNVQTEDEPSTASQNQLCGSAIQQEMQKPLQKSSNQLAEVLTPQLSQTATQEPRSDDAKQQVGLLPRVVMAAGCLLPVRSGRWTELLPLSELLLLLLALPLLDPPGQPMSVYIYTASFAYIYTASFAYIYTASFAGCLLPVRSGRWTELLPLSELLLLLLALPLLDPLGQPMSVLPSLILVT